ncbi:hypothetical protein ABK040_003973 [Willaertia magna]
MKRLDVNGLSNKELEFIAEETPIRINPLRNLERVKLLTCTVGPALANQEITVPLWVALHLKRLKQCKIIIPEWLTISNLEDISARSSQTSDLIPVPPNFIEISYTLMKYARDDFTEIPEDILSLLKTIEDKRRDNLADGLVGGLMGSEASDYLPGYMFKNLTAMEINRIRKATCEVLERRDKMYRLSTTSSSGNNDNNNNEEEEDDDDEDEE